LFVILLYLGMVYCLILICLLGLFGLFVCSLDVTLFVCGVCILIVLVYDGILDDFVFNLMVSFVFGVSGFVFWLVCCLFICA